jgi:hypothetical protein
MHYPSPLAQTGALLPANVKDRMDVLQWRGREWLKVKLKVGETWCGAHGGGLMRSSVSPARPSRRTSRTCAWTSRRSRCSRRT